MATKTGTITVRPTKYGAKSSTNITGESNFIAGTGDLVNTKSTRYYIILYGLNFNVLQGLNNPQITSVTISVTAKNSGYASSGSALLRFVTNFPTSGTTTSGYTDVGGGYDNVNYSWSTSERDNYYLHNYSIDHYPDLITWMNSNIDEVINGYTSNSFGLQLGIKYLYIKDITLTIGYTYEIPTVTVTTSVSPAGAGTVTPTHQVESGSTATVSAIPNAGYKFSHWLIDGTDSGVTSTTLSGTVTSNMTITAVFILDKINKIYIGTSQPKAIYVGTQEVKAVYVGTTKVYG